MPTYEIKYKRRKVSGRMPEAFKNPKEVADYLLKNCYNVDELWREQAYALFLDARNRIKGHLLVSYGGTASTTLDIRLIVKAALDTFAFGVVLSHNHPQGDPEPSSADIKMTADLKKALSLFDINLTDHIIIGEKSIFAFSEDVATKYKIN